MADFIHEQQRSMESTRPIRALVRGLDALTMLNLRNGATVLRAPGLPETGLKFAIDAAAAPITAQVFDESYGLPDEVPDGKILLRARPKNATSSQDGDVTVVQRTVRLDPAAGR